MEEELKKIYMQAGANEFCNYLRGKMDATQLLSLWEGFLKRANTSSADILDSVPNQAMKDFSVQGALREYEYSDTFKHLFSDSGEVL